MTATVAIIALTAYCWPRRSSPLKRSPLSRSASQLKRTRIQPVSARRRKSFPARARCVKLVMARCGGRCELNVAGVCQGRAIELHEPLKRSRGGDPTDPAQCRATCRACHDFTEREPAKATALGLLISRYPGKGAKA